MVRVAIRKLKADRKQPRGTGNNGEGPETMERDRKQRRRRKEEQDNGPRKQYIYSWGCRILERCSAREILGQRVAVRSEDKKGAGVGKWEAVHAIDEQLRGSRVGD